MAILSWSDVESPGIPVGNEKMPIRPFEVYCGELTVAYSHGYSPVQYHGMCRSNELRYLTWHLVLYSQGFSRNISQEYFSHYPASPRYIASWRFLMLTIFGIGDVSRATLANRDAHLKFCDIAYRHVGENEDTLD